MYLSVGFGGGLVIVGIIIVLYIFGVFFGLIIVRILVGVVFGVVSVMYGVVKFGIVKI